MLCFIEFGKFHDGERENAKPIEEEKCFGIIWIVMRICAYRDACRYVVNIWIWNVFFELKNNPHSQIFWENIVLHSKNHIDCTGDLFEYFFSASRGKTIANVWHIFNAIYNVFIIFARFFFFVIYILDGYAHRTSAWAQASQEKKH